MANLLAIRKQFIKLSGRHDLASGGIDIWDTDEGADWFINAGSRWLDVSQETLLSEVEWQESFTSGSYLVALKKARAITHVYRKASNGKKKLLQKRTMDWLLANYPELDSTDNGTPSYWAPVITHRAPEQVASGSSADVKSIYLMPPADGSYTISVFGLFHQLELSDNADTNYWSSEYPDLLVLAALMMLETFYRNTQGVRDYREAIETILIGLDRDAVEATDQELHRLEG
jgi:hypothetical protein